MIGMNEAEIAEWRRMVDWLFTPMREAGDFILGEASNPDAPWNGPHWTGAD